LGGLIDLRYDKAMSTPGEIAAGAAVELFFVVIAFAVLYRVWGLVLSGPKEADR
jgi:hypothetical protein